MNNSFFSCVPVITAQISILILGVCALYNGLDGAIFATCIAALAGLGGYQLKILNSNNKNFPPKS